MPTLNETLRRIANLVRVIPNDFGLRPYRVFVQQQSSLGTYEGRNPQPATEVEILNGEPPRTSPPKVRFLTDEELALGGFERGTVRIGPVTPDYPGGGTQLDTLAPEGSGSTDTVRVRLERYDGGSGSGLYRIKATHADRGLQYSLICERAV